VVVKDYVIIYELEIYTYTSQMDQIASGDTIMHNTALAVDAASSGLVSVTSLTHLGSRPLKWSVTQLWRLRLSMK
jgi:hypothetical protein